LKDIEEHIRRAMEEGKFNDLPGKGKPLNLDDNPLADPEWRLANHVLKSGGFTLPWMEARNELEKDIQAARADLARTWNWKKGVSAAAYAEAEVEWQRAVKAFHDRVAELNKRIRSYNLGTPSDRFQLFLINPDREINDLTAGDPPDGVSPCA